MKKMIPIGISEFREVREKNYYYVDKTNLITNLLEDGTKVTLFTRPRRFGKTLNMTMLREFFDITKDSKRLFKGLEVEKSDCFQEINQYPTLFFSFRDCKGDKESVIENIKVTLLEEYLKYNDIKEKLDEYELERYDQIFMELKEDSSLDTFYTKKAISFLSKVLCRYYGKPVVLIIDEYDTPMVETYMGGYYQELRNFFTALYGSALKDNPYLEKGILTGIQQVAKENIFSGLNNLKVYTVRSRKFHTFFGLTSEESKDLLAYFNLELTEEVTKMYNGYNFGGLQIYNPWSMNNYIDELELKAYWVHTATNALIRKLIQTADQPFFEMFERLISDKQVKVVLDPRTSFWESNNTKTLWGLLLNSGYITVKESEEGLTSTIVIPNREVKTEFQEIVSEYTHIGSSSLIMMFTSLIYDGDINMFKKIYQDIVLRNTSYYDAKENAYHMLFLGMCVYLDSDYDIKSNIETGEGRSDIVLTSFHPERYPNLIIEFKQGESVEELAQVAINQIKEKQYVTNMKGKTILMGVAHNKKKCEIKTEEYNTNCNHNQRVRVCN